jgi:hypothetical protein
MQTMFFSVLRNDLAYKIVSECMTKLLLFFKTTIGRNVIKLFISVIRNKLECLSLESVYQPCLKFATKSTVYLSAAVENAPLRGRLLTLDTYIRLGWKGLPGTNTLAYYEN